MSPPHLALATGILVSTLAVIVGLARLLPSVESNIMRRIVKTTLVPAFAAFWFSAIWYIFFFVLPLSNGQHFTSNPDPVAAVVIATSVLPFMSAVIFLVSAKTIGRLGAASAVAGIVIGMNVLANVIPAFDFLGPFLPWQLLALVPVVIGADFAIHRMRNRAGIMIAGALIGITFYVFNYPMLPMAFAELLNQPNASLSDTLPSMYATMPQVIALTAAPSALAGIVGAIAGSRRIRIPHAPNPVADQK
jgi:hypothetical protein